MLPISVLGIGAEVSDFSRSRAVVMLASGPNTKVPGHTVDNRCPGYGL